MGKILSTKSPQGAEVAGVSRFHLLIVLAVVFSLRLLHMGSALHSPTTFQPGPDEEFYFQFAQAVIAPGPLDSAFAFMDPAYGYMLGALFKLFGPSLFVVFFVQILLDTATAFGIFLVSREIGRPKAGLIAALLYGLTSSAILLTTTLLKEIWVANFMVLWVLSTLFVLRLRKPWLWVFLGILSGVGIALRSNLILMVGLALILLPWLLRTRDARPWPEIFHGLCLMLVGMSLPLVFLSLRNEQLSQHFSPIPNNGGVVLHQLYNSENPDSVSTVPGFVSYYHPLEVWRDYSHEAERRQGRHLTPDEIDKYWRGQAMAYIGQHPGQVMGNIARKLSEFFAYIEVPNNRSMVEEKMFSPVLRWLPQPFTWLIAMGLPGLFGLLRVDRRALLLISPILVAAATVAIFFAEDRFRFPAVPMLALGSGLFLESVFIWWRAGQIRQVMVCIAAALLLGIFSLVCSLHIPPPQITWSHLVWGYIKMGRMTEALTVTGRLTNEQLNNSSIQEALGYIALSQGRDPDAILAYQRAVEIRPGSHVAHYNLAKLLAKNGNREAALREAKIAEHLSPQADYQALVADLGRP